MDARRRPGRIKVLSAAIAAIKVYVRSNGGTVTVDSSPSDRELVRRMARREEDALAALYDRYAPAALALAARVAGDRAEGEDVLQTVFVRLWQEAERYDETRGSVAAWIMSAVRNASIDRVRRRGAFERATEQAAFRPAPEPSPSVPGVTEDHQRVRQAMESLPPDQREAIELAYFKGITQTQIAERLKQPLGTVKTRVRLGMLKLRQTLLGQPQEQK